MKPEPQQACLLELTVYGKRKQGMSEEHFIKHRTHKYRPLFVEWLVKHGIIGYTLVSGLSRRVRLPNARLMKFVS